MIPKNDTDQEKVAKQNAKQFRDEVEQVEEYIFSKKWETAADDHTPMPEHVWTGVGKKFNSFLMTKEHWEAIVADIKEAGYYVYRKRYYNRLYEDLYGDHCIVKAPLTPAQRLHLHLQEDCCTHSGPYREQSCGEML